MKIFLCGQKAFGAAVAEAIARQHDIVGVSSPPWSSRAGTGGEQHKDRTRVVAERLGIPWSPSGTFRAETVPSGTDVIVAAHAHDYIGARCRAAARYGAIGYHPSLLPVHRGRDAVRWTIKMGDRIAGGSVYWLSQDVDGGPIAAQQFVFVRPGETVQSLWQERLAPLGVSLIVDVLADIAAGRIVKTPQDESCATWEPSWNRPPMHRPEATIQSSSHAGQRVITDELQDQVTWCGYVKDVPGTPTGACMRPGCRCNP